MKISTKTRIRLYGRILFILYLLLLTYFLFFAESYGRTADTGGQYRYNLVLFQEISRFWRHRKAVGMTACFLNIGGNILGFMPFGFILPVVHRNMNSFWLVTFLGFSMSLLVECVQLVSRVGSFDVDDMLLNTIGTMLGYILFAVCNRIRKVYDEKKI